MKSLIIISTLLLVAFAYGQDTIYDTSRGDVLVKRIGIGKLHRVQPEYERSDWISGKVARVNYNYTYRRTFHGSTRPANPEQFYKPIKRKSCYFIPASDILIKHSRGKVFQSFSLDSLILRTYRDDGSRKNIFYFNSDLQVDSIVRYYKNGNVRTRLIGGTNQPENNLVLSLSYRPELTLRNPPREWQPDTRSALYLADRMSFSDYRGSSKTSYPSRQEHCHGNGEPYVVITYVPDSTQVDVFQPQYQFYDPEGNPLENVSITGYGQWSGEKYSYYETGILESKRYTCDNRNCGLYERWNRDGTRYLTEYWNGPKRDSVVYFKQLGDLQFRWQRPMKFQWNRFDTLVAVEHTHCRLGFDNDGSVLNYSFDGVHRDTREKTRDSSLILQHFGSKDTLGFPHGKWFGVNLQKDTVYEVNFNHGWLHGPYKADFETKQVRVYRTYDMGLEIDSSILYRKGFKDVVHYYSNPGVMVKSTHYHRDTDHISYVDTMVNVRNAVYNNRKSIRLRSFDKEGWLREKTTFDTISKTFHNCKYTTPNTLSYEYWSDYYEHRSEWKSYHSKTGALNVHWKDEGIQEKINENGEKLAIRVFTEKTYDYSGKLLMLETVHNRRLVERKFSERMRFYFLISGIIVWF